MANLGKPPTKKKKRFGAPPPVEEASDTLVAPETAPATQPAAGAKKARAKTGRVEAFNTRVSAEFKTDFETEFFQGKLKRQFKTRAEFLEILLEEYKRQKDK